ncbi:MAG TPA: CcmD family protein [Longimicrobium sp.]|jgi:CcmD family protein
MRRAFLAPFLALSLAFASAPLRAQEPAPAASAPAPAATPNATQALRTTAQTLPEQSAPPRTLRAYWHVFAAFTFAWLMILGYAISLARRFRSLEQKVDAMGETDVGK